MRTARIHSASHRAARITSAVTGFAGIAALAGVVALAPPSGQLSVTPVAAIVDSPDTVGISDNDLYWDANDPASVQESLDRMQALGIQNIRVAVPWAAVEPADGYYDWSSIDAMVNAADARGMGVLAVVNTSPTWTRGVNTTVYNPPSDPTAFSDFLRTLSSRYAGKVGAYEVWNEPNYYAAWSPAPDPAGYAALLEAAYPAIKAGDPDAQVIGGVLGSTLTWGSYTLNPVDFVQQMYAAGAAGSFDALSFHPYQNTLMFSQGPSVSTESPLSQLTRIRALMSSNGDASKEIWASEYGLPTGTVGEQNQATYIGDFLNTWSTLPYAGPAFLYTLDDRNSSDTTDPESTFGLYRDDGTLKPAASVVAEFIASHTTSSTSAARDAALVSSTSSSATPTSGASTSEAPTETATSPSASTTTPESEPATTPASGTPETAQSATPTTTEAAPTSAAPGTSAAESTDETDDAAAQTTETQSAAPQSAAAQSTPTQTTATPTTDAAPSTTAESAPTAAPTTTQETATADVAR